MAISNIGVKPAGYTGFSGRTVKKVDDFWKKRTMPPGANACYAALEGAGHRAYLVGGCVRDWLRGEEPGDLDMTTSARPEQVMALFPHTVPTGLKHGTVTVLTAGEKIEITTFRAETGYSDGRHPDRVDFVDSLEADLARRDFTVNAMAVDRAGHLTDPFGGLGDLAAGRIRCVGRGEERFREDGLRMLRGVRFAAQLGFSIEKETAAAVAACAPLIARVAPQRVAAETEKLLCSRAPERGRGIADYGLLDPWLDSPGGYSMAALSQLPRDRVSRWAGLCAALAEKGRITAPGPFLRRLAMDNQVVRACEGGWRILKGGLPVTRAGWRKAAAEEGVAAARAGAAMGGEEDRAELEAALEEATALSPKELALSGGELVALGLRGADIGRAQRFLLDRVLEEPERNGKKELAALLQAGEHGILHHE